MKEIKADNYSIWIGEKSISKLDVSKIDQKTDIVYETIITFCENYEKLCKKKYPEAPLPLEILKSDY